MRNIYKTQRTYEADERALARLVVWLFVAAIGIGGVAIHAEYRSIAIPALAEDDCSPYHGAYTLKDVEPRLEGNIRTGVNCVYGSWL